MRGPLVFDALLLASSAYAVTASGPRHELDPHVVVNTRIGSIQLGFSGGREAWVR